MNEDTDNLEDAIDATGRNLTQQRMDAAGAEDRPVDVVQSEALKPPPDPSEVALDPEVPLVAEGDRAAVASSGRRRLVLVGAAVAGLLLGLRRLLRR